jgi:hypothetical protein
MHGEIFPRDEEHRVKIFADKNSICISQTSGIFSFLLFLAVVFVSLVVEGESFDGKIVLKCSKWHFYHFFINK